MEYPPRDGRQAVGDGIIPVLLGRPGPYVGRGIYRRHDDVARKEGVDVFRRALPHRIDEQARKEKRRPLGMRSEEHTSELQSLMRISYAVFCLKKKKKNNH